MPPQSPRRSVTSAESDAKPWTTRRLMDWMTNHFTSRNIDSPRVCAEMLLAHVLGCERLRLYMDVDRPATATELATLRDLTARAAKHEPVQYLVGHGWFFGRQFTVNSSTLIPRPSTESLVEFVLQRERAEPRPEHPVIADIGTGTGCIAISLAAGLQRARIIATDLVPQAIELARTNATAHKVADRIEFHVGDGLAPLRSLGGVRFDYLCSNPPYISDAEWADVPPNVKLHEPESALRGGSDGLKFIRPIVADAAELLKPGGMLLLEIAESQKDAAMDLAVQAGWAEPRVLKDHENLWRVLVAERPA